MEHEKAIIGVIFTLLIIIFIIACVAAGTAFQSKKNLQRQIDNINNTSGNLSTQIKQLSTSVDIIDTELSNATTNIDNIQSEIITITDDIVSMESEILNITNDIDSIESNIETIESDIVTITGDIDNIESEIITITGNINTIESDIVTITGNIDTIESDIVTITGDIDTIDSNIVTITNDIDTIESEISTITNDIDTIDSNIITITNDIDTIESQISTITSDIGTLQTNVSTLNTTKVSKAGDTMTGPLNMNSQNITNVNTLSAITNITVNSQSCAITKCYIIQPLNGYSSTTDEFIITNPPARINGNLDFSANAPVGFTFSLDGFATLNLASASTLTVRFKINSVTVSTLVVSRGSLNTSQGLNLRYTIQLRSGFTIYRRVIFSGALEQFNLGGSGDITTVVSQGGQNDSSWETANTNTISITGQFSDAGSSWTQLEQMIVQKNLSY